MKKYQRNKLKKLLREAMLARDGYTCQRAGEDTCGGALHTSHIFPVGVYKKMEFEIENVTTLCQRHHLYWWHKHPIEASDWIHGYLPKERMDNLDKLASRKEKVILDYEEIKTILEGQITDCEPEAL